MRKDYEEIELETLAEIKEELIEIKELLTLVCENFKLIRKVRK